MIRSSDRIWPRPGYRIVRPTRIPHRFLLRQLEAIARPDALARMLQDIREHGAGPWRVAALSRLTDRHPDRVCGDTVYTHTVRILYRPTNRPGTWECVYGLTEGGQIHLWMD